MNDFSKNSSSSKWIFGFAVAGAALGVAYYFGSQSLRSQSVTALKEKERQTADQIQKLVEKEGHVSRKKGDQPLNSKNQANLKIQEVPVVAHGESQPAQAAGVCSSLEIFGAGPEQVDVDLMIWSQFMSDYHLAKANLLQWVSANKTLFSDNLAAEMEREIRSTRVMRPQNQIEPDLSWRGIAAWTRPQSTSPSSEGRPALIHVSSGFLELFKKNRARARFEMARLLAQGVSPCELQAAKQAKPWKDFFACLNLTDELAKCTPGAVAEATWAVSSAVASLVSQPGCAVPAFHDEKARACLQGFHRGDVASYELEAPKKSAARSIASAQVQTNFQSTKSQQKTEKR
ncbi:MAG: hypothetical protein ACK5QT_08545 [Oligoflexia bacterium]